MSELATLDREAIALYDECQPRVRRARPSRAVEQNADRNAHMVALRQQGMTLEEIGTMHGITRERVRQLVTKVNPALGSQGSLNADPVSVVAFLRSPAATSVHSIAVHVGTAPAAVERLLAELGLLDAARRLFRLRRLRRREARREYLLAKIRAFMEREGRQPYGIEMGTVAGTPKRPDLPAAQQCSKIFGSLDVMWRRLGVSRRRPGKQGPRVTHCKHGHEYTPENTYTHRNGRTCKTCVRAGKKRAYAERKGASA